MTTHAQDEAVPGLEPAVPSKSALATAGVAVLILLLIAAAACALYLAYDRARLEEQVLQQSTQLLELRERLTKAEVALQEKTAAVATRDAALAEANKPLVPVRVTFRLAFMGQGLVATLRNVSPNPLHVIAELREPGSEATQSISLALEPNGSTEIGYQQGWTIRSGESITVTASGYRSVTAFAP